MARIHGIAVLACIAAGTGLWLAVTLPDDDAPPWQPESPPAADGDADAAPPAGMAERTPLPERDGGGAAGDPDVDGAPQAPAATDAAPAPAEPEPPPTLEVRVRDIADQRPIEQFTWRFQAAAPPGGGAPPEPLQGAGDAGALTLALPPGSRGRLMIEAAGYEPVLHDVALPAVSTAPVQRDVFLAATASLAGVSITAVDAAGAPVERLRLDIWQLPDDATADPAPGMDPEGRTMWSRTGAGPDGVFRLPALTAGRYALRAQPCADDGAPRPLQPQRRVFAFHGNEAVPLQLQFEPGVVLAIDAAPADVPQRELRAVVRGTDGTPVPVLWRSGGAATGDGGAGAGWLVAQNAVRLPGPASTLLALPRGDYALELLRGDVPVPVLLAPSARRGDEPGVRRFTATLPR